MSPILLPPLPTPDLLADLCKETAARERVQPAMVEKDLYLTRLLWALGQALGAQLLLKGGTLLSKVDLGFRRMSEDADMIIPRAAHGRRRDNTLELDRVRSALRELSGSAGFQLPLPDGQASDRGGHRVWELLYVSQLGNSAVRLEVSLRPALRPSRRVSLNQLLTDPLAGDYRGAFAFALDAAEARAEKVRAAFTREAIRDFHDLEQLALAGADFKSDNFLELVDAKLAELERPPLRMQPRSFGLTPPRRRELDASLRRDLPAVLRVGEPAFELDPMLKRFNELWGAK